MMIVVAGVPQRQTGQWYRLFSIFPDLFLLMKNGVAGKLALLKIKFF